MGTILVTGAAGALGGAVCRLLLARGHQLAAVDKSRRSSRLDELVAESKGAAVAVAMDCASSTDARAGVEQVERKLGPLTGAVLIAGGWQGGKPFHEESDDTWTAMFGMNLDTAQHTLRAVLPGMAKRGTGSVVLIGSRAVERPWEGAGAAAYTASKAALVALVRATAAELLDARVRVNAVLPSTIDTPANRSAMPDADHSKWVALDSLAKVIAFLLSDESEAVSGAALPVYGRS